MMNSLTHKDAHVPERALLVLVQEISSLVGEARAESSEAVALVAEEEEPMHAENQSEHAEASVLQVQVESSEATAAAQVSSRTDSQRGLEPTDGVVLPRRWSPRTAAFPRSSCPRKETPASWFPGRRR